MAYTTDNKAPLGHPLFHLADALVGFRQRQSNRRETEKLALKSEHMLRDIGVTREQVQDVLSSPSSEDASEALRRISLERRGPWT